MLGCSVADGFPFDLPAWLRSSVEGCFGVRELLTELHELGAIHQFLGPWEHLGLFFFRMMLNEILEHLGIGRKFIGVRIRLLDLWEHQVDHVMLLQRFEVELLVIFLFAGLTEGRVEDVLFDLRMDLVWTFSSCSIVLSVLCRFRPSASSSFESNSRMVLWSCLSRAMASC